MFNPFLLPKKKKKEEIQFALFPDHFGEVAHPLS
jgi:hypothetical protein